jgi:hypothetical protein
MKTICVCVCVVEYSTILLMSSRCVSTVVRIDSSVTTARQVEYLGNERSRRNLMCLQPLFFSRSTACDHFYRCTSSVFSIRERVRRSIAIESVSRSLSVCSFSSGYSCCSVRNFNEWKTNNKLSKHPVQTSR